MKTTVLNEFHRQKGAKMVSFADFDMPLYYTSIIDEHLTVRKGVGIFDVSHMGKVLLKGKGCEEFLLKVLTNSVAKEKVGNAIYTHILNKDGNIIDDMILYKLSEDSYYTIPNAAKTKQIKSWFEENMTDIDTKPEINLEMEDVTMDMVCFALQGPKATDTLQGLTDFDLNDIKFFRFRIFKYENGRLSVTNERFPAESTFLISRTGYTGEDGFEIIASNATGVKLWDTILEAGQKFGIKPIGLGARDTLRLEKGFLLSGTDFDGNRTTLETNWTFAIDWDHDFIGKEPMLKQKESDNYELLVGVEMKGSGIPRHGHAIHANGKQIGTITSGSMSPVLKKGIGLGYVEKQHSEPGMEIEIEIRGKMINASVIKLPFV